MSFIITAEVRFNANAASNLAKALDKAVGDWAESSAEVARKTTAFKDRTGATRRSIKANEVKDATGSVQASGPGAIATEYGTRPHVIVPRVARILTWLGPQGAVFARRVNHPGIKARHWLWKAVLHRHKAAARAVARKTVVALRIRSGG